MMTDTKRPAGVADLAAMLDADRGRALTLTSVSRETARRLDDFVKLLLQWQATTNLIAPSTIGEVWTRHIADSLQLVPLAPRARIWVDLGSGAGFPGLVIACAQADVPGTTVHLVESNAKKAAFLREAARITGAPAHIHAVRIEEFVTHFHAHVDVVTARALAPLDRLLPLIAPLLKRGAQALLMKGQDVEAELTQASKYWNIRATSVASKTDPNASILVVHSLTPRQIKA